MTVQYSTAVRINMLDAIEVICGYNPRLVFYAGTKPTLCSDSIGAATTLATLPLTGAGGDFMSPAAAVGNVVTKAKNPASTWTATASGSGTASFYRLWDATMTTCHEQGTVTATGGGGDITLDNTTIAINQTITVTGKTITAGNA